MWERVRDSVREWEREREGESERKGEVEVERGKMNEGDSASDYLYDQSLLSYALVTITFPETHTHTHTI